MNQTNDQNIYHLIFNQKDFESIDDQIMSEYLSDLSSMGVNQLTAEPQRLSDLRSSVTEKTQSLAFNNYQTFITTADCADYVIKDFNTIESRLNHIIQTVPKFENSCQNFSKEAKSISKRWKEVSQMLAKHPQILEVLEIPQLMNTCVRNNYYEEALELYCFVQKLNNRYNNSIPVIGCIAKEVELFQEVMMNQLLKEIHNHIQLPACLRVIQYLRRMQKFSEGELRIKFLNARDSWLQSIIKDIPNNNPLIHITKVIETNRVNLFDIITQYRAIFADHEPIVSSTARYFGVTTNQTSNRDFSDSAIINSWVSFKMNQFFEVLKQDLNRCVNNDFNHYYPIESIIEPCFYFGLSMSRIGADFRPQIIPIINNAILQRFSKVVTEGTKRFECSIQSLTLSQDLVNQTVSFTVGGDENDNDFHPPTSLLEFPLLAHYCNDMLTSMNEMRQTTPLALITSFASILNHSFQCVSRAICRYFKSEESGLSSGEKEIFYRLCDRYINDLLPHLSKCFQYVCPLSTIADNLGVSLIELIKVKDLKFSIDIESVSEPVISLLPNSNGSQDIN